MPSKADEWWVMAVIGALALGLGVGSFSTNRSLTEQNAKIFSRLPPGCRDAIRRASDELYEESRANAPSP